MAQLLVRNFDDSLKVRLQRRAKKHGRSMEEEARDILRNALRESTPSFGLGSEISEIFREHGLHNGEEIQEIRGHIALPAKFDE